MDLTDRSDRELLSGVSKLVGSHREISARLVAYLGEIEGRRLHLKAGFSSMFEFCVKELRLSEGEAFRRILAARLVRRFPAVLPLIATGAVHLSALELLRERLTTENHAELLAAVSGKTKREVEALLAARFSRPDVPEKIRKLPSMPTRSTVTEASPPAAGSNSTFELEPPPTPSIREKRARIEPLSPGRYRVELTVSAELREKLERCRDLMSHANPGRDLEAVIERSLDLLLADLEGKRLGRSKRALPPRTADAAPAEGSARVKTAVRRESFERDGTQCTYVSPSGRRCEARAFLELDHVTPRALGGRSDAANLRVRCRAHNQLWAEEVFGRSQVESARYFRQQKRPHPDRDGDDRQLDGPSGLPPSTIHEKVRQALRAMGFSDVQARRATAQVERNHVHALTLEQALREALRLATEAA